MIRALQSVISLFCRCLFRFVLLLHYRPLVGKEETASQVGTEPVETEERQAFLSFGRSKENYIATSKFAFY